LEAQLGRVIVDVAVLGASSMGSVVTLCSRRTGHRDASSWPSQVVLFDLTKRTRVATTKCDID
jgi:hypothetical protein